MRVTAGEISKLVTEAMREKPRFDLKAPAGSVSGAGRGAIRGGGSERTMDRWARAAANGDLERGTRQSASGHTSSATKWTSVDDRRVKYVANKLGKMMRAAVFDAIENDTPEHVFTVPEMNTIKKMSHQELVDAINDSKGAQRLVSDLVDWAIKSVPYPRLNGKMV
jgi:hypothetical protein